MDHIERLGLRSFTRGDGLKHLPGGQLLELHLAVKKELVSRQIVCKHEKRELDEGCGVTADRLTCVECGDVLVV